jgi:signal transduction histidine kinase
MKGEPVGPLSRTAQIDDAETGKLLHAAHRALAHEVRGALNTASLHLGLLREAVRDPDDGDREDRLARTVDVLARQQAELQRSIADLIDLTRPPGGGTASFDLVAMCREAARLAARGAGASEPVLEAPATPVLVREDRDAVRRTIVEAALAAARGGGVTLRLTADAERARLVVTPPAGDAAESHARRLDWALAPREEV